jgi:hypothetical protein
VQFASRKLPLYGDGRYGAGDGKQRPALFSCRLSLQDRFDCTEMPADYPFTLFSSVRQGVDLKSDPLI